MIKKRNGTARVILILCAAIGILAGCGKGTGDSENASGAENKSADSSSGTEENAGEETGQNNGVESVIVLRTSSGFSLRQTDGTVIDDFEGVLYRGYPSEGKFLVEQNGKLGVMDFNGNFIISPQYDSAENRDSMGGYDVLKFSEDMAVIKENGVYGFIDKNGKTVIEPQFDDASPFSDGLARVKSGGKYGYIDHTGNFIVEPILDSCYSFSHNLAQAELNGSWGIINSKGEFTLEEHVSPVSPYGELGTFDFHDGLAVVEADSYYGYINEAGEMAIEPIFKQAGAFSDGIACVQVYVEGYGDLYGFINTSGEYVIEPQYIEAKDFSEGLAYVRGSMIDGNPDGYIDLSGNCIIEIDPSAPLLNASGFNEGKAFVIKSVDEGSYPCYIDTAGNEVIRLDQLNATHIYSQGEFKSGYAIIMTNDNHVGLIDHEGNVVFEPEYTSIIGDYLSNGILIVSLEDGTMGVAAPDGSWIVEPGNYTEIAVLEQ